MRKRKKKTGAKVNWFLYRKSPLAVDEHRVFLEIVKLKNEFHAQYFGVLPVVCYISIIKRGTNKYPKEIGLIYMID